MRSRNSFDSFFGKPKASFFKFFPFGKSKHPTFDRTYLFSAFFVAAFVGITSNLFGVQVIQREAFLAQAQKAYSGREEILPRRGDIVFGDRDGKTFAVARTEKLFTVYWNARTSSPETLDSLNDIIPLVRSKADTLRLAEGGQSYVLVAKKVPLRTAREIVRQKIAVDLEEEIVRTYPFQNLGSRTIGFAMAANGGREEGQYGLEAYYDSLLNGTEGLLGDRVVFQGGTDGATLVTTIDMNIQREAERVVKRGVEKHQAEGGLAVVMDAKNGEILAVADEPGFNPNQYAKVSNYGVFRSSLGDPYEPGSVFKAITFAAALDRGVIDPADTYDDRTALAVDGYVIQNYDQKGHGVITLQKALDHSYNLGAIHVLEKLGFDTFRSYVEKFSIGKKTGIDMPFEKPGSISNITGIVKRKVNFFTTSFGQGVSVTPAQLLAAFSAFANRGTMIRPHLVREIEYANGDAQTIGREVIGAPISPEAAERITQMLEHVVESGSGKYARLKGFRVAGKTGSAQVPAPGGYSSDDIINTFVGYFPASNPRVIILVKLEKPSASAGPRWSEITAVPMWRDIASYVAQYLYLSPDAL